MKRAFMIVALILAATPGPVSAVAVDEAVLEDTVQEERARALMKGLRCLVCQNQSIDESDADLARDLRILVRERIGLGESDDQVIAYLVARYGDWILLEPPVKPQTLILWIGPPAMVLIGLVVVVVARRRRSALVEAVPLSAEEQASLDALLSDEDDR